MAYNDNEISVKVVEMIITIGGIAGALIIGLQEINKPVYITTYCLFLLLTFVDYIALLGYSKISNLQILVSFLSSLFFVIVFTITLFDTGSIYNLVTSYVIMLTLAGLISAIKIRGLNPTRKHWLYKISPIFRPKH